MQKPKLTKRKFYNKWLYKITLFCPGVSLYRLLGYNETINYLVSPTTYKKSVFSSHHKALKNKINFLALTTFLSKLNKQDFAQRIESNTIDLYVNDESIFDSLSSTFESIVVNRYAPTGNNLELLENTLRGQTGLSAKINSKAIFWWQKLQKFRQFSPPEKLRKCVQPPVAFANVPRYNSITLGSPSNSRPVPV